MQPLLPQYILVNEHTMSVAEAATARASLPPHVRLFRLKTAWNSLDLLLLLLKDVKRVLEPHAETLQPVLLLDTVAFHWHPEVLRARRRHRLEVVLVPALLTHLLQPLDSDGSEDEDEPVGSAAAAGTS